MLLSKVHLLTYHAVCYFKELFHTSIISFTQLFDSFPRHDFYFLYLTFLLSSTSIRFSIFTLWLSFSFKVWMYNIYYIIPEDVGTKTLYLSVCDLRKWEGRNWQSQASFSIGILIEVHSWQKTYHRLIFSVWHLTEEHVLLSWIPVMTFIQIGNQIQESLTFIKRVL